MMEFPRTNVLEHSFNGKMGGKKWRCMLLTHDIANCYYAVLTTSRPPSPYIEGSVQSNLNNVYLLLRHTGLKCIKFEVPQAYL